MASASDSSSSCYGSCGGGGSSSGILKPVLLTFLIPLAIGLGLALLYLLGESAKIGIIAFLQQQQSEQQEEQQSSNNNNVNVNNVNEVKMLYNFVKS